MAARSADPLAEAPSVLSVLARARAGIDASVAAATRHRRANPQPVESRGETESLRAELRALREEHAELRAALRAQKGLPPAQIAFTIAAVAVMWAAVLYLKSDAAGAPLVILAMAHLSGCIVLLAFGRRPRTAARQAEEPSP
jgi:hypothetical protein